MKKSRSNNAKESLCVMSKEEYREKWGAIIDESVRVELMSQEGYTFLNTITGSFNRKLKRVKRERFEEAYKIYSEAMVK